MPPLPADYTASLRILQPYPGIYAYYDGRIPGKRLHSPSPNWLDDGGFVLGTASYAIVDGPEALLHDTHMSLAHAAAIRAHLTGLGVTSFKVALSHHHDDHIAGNEIFADSEIIALTLTADLMTQKRHAMETADPPILPVIMPTRTYERRLDLTIGNRAVELHHFDIHSCDGAVIWLPDIGVLLAGDTVEDTVTYLAEPKRLAIHVGELTRMQSWPIHRILPAHGDPAIIAAGGYPPSLIAANKAYLERLIATAGSDDRPLADFAAPEIAAGSIVHFEPYDEVHRNNLAKVRRAVTEPAG